MQAVWAAAAIPGGPGQEPTAAAAAAVRWYGKNGEYGWYITSVQLILHASGASTSSTQPHTGAPETIGFPPSVTLTATSRPRPPPTTASPPSYEHTGVGTPAIRERHRAGRVEAVLAVLPMSPVLRMRCVSRNFERLRDTLHQLATKTWRRSLGDGRGVGNTRRPRARRAGAWREGGVGGVTSRGEGAYREGALQTGGGGGAGGRCWGNGRDGFSRRRK